MPRDLPTATDPVPPPPSLALAEAAGTDESGDEHARVRHEQIARIRTVARQIAISRGLAVTDAERWIADTRRYLRHLLDYAPYVEGVYPCKVVSIEDRTLRHCTVELLEDGRVIPQVLYDPTVPSVGQEYAVRETKRLNPLQERGLPEHVHWTLKVPTGQWLYHDNATGTRLFRVEWPPGTAAPFWGDPEITAISMDTPAQQPVGPLLWSSGDGTQTRKEVLALGFAATSAPGEFTFQDGTPTGPGAQAARGYGDWGMDPENVRTFTNQAQRIDATSNTGARLSGQAHHERVDPQIVDGVVNIGGSGGSGGHLEVRPHAEARTLEWYVAPTVADQGDGDSAERLHLGPPPSLIRREEDFSLHGAGDVVTLYQGTDAWYARGGLRGLGNWTWPDHRYSLWTSFKIVHNPPSLQHSYAPAFPRIQPPIQPVWTITGSPVEAWLAVDVDGSTSEQRFTGPPGTPTAYVNGLEHAPFLFGAAAMPDPETVVLWLSSPGHGVYWQRWPVHGATVAPDGVWHSTPLQDLVCVSTDGQAVIGTRTGGGWLYTNDFAETWAVLPTPPLGGSPRFFVWDQ